MSETEVDLHPQMSEIELQDAILRRCRSALYWLRHPRRWMKYVRVQSALYGPLAIFGLRNPANMDAYRALPAKVRLGQ